jgi:hypothetical protein
LIDLTFGPQVCGDLAVGGDREWLGRCGHLTEHPAIVTGMSLMCAVLHGFGCAL